MSIIKIKKRTINILAVVCLLCTLAFADTYFDDGSTGIYVNTSYGGEYINLTGTNTTGTYTNGTTDLGTWQNITFWKYTGWELHDELDGDERLVEELDTTGLVLYMDFNNNSNDFSGLGNNADLVSNVDLGTDVIGQLNMSGDWERGSNSHLKIPDDDSLDGMDAISISLWVKREEVGQYHYLIGKDEDINVGDSYRFYIGNDNKVYWTPRDSCTDSAKLVMTTTNTLTSGVWYHIVANYNHAGANNASIWINGINQSTTTVGTTTFPIANCTSKLTIGARYDSSDGVYKLPMDGNMDELSIWNKSLSPSEITNLYKRGITRLNLSATDGTTTLSSGYDSTYINISSLSGAINWTAYFETDNYNYSQRLYNISIGYDAAAVTSNIDLLFATTYLPTIYITNFDSGEDFYSYINYTNSTGDAIGNDTAICNMTFVNGIHSYDTSNQNFTLCGVACDYIDIYTENITSMKIINAQDDLIHFSGCHLQLSQGDIILNVSCGTNSSQWTIDNSELPLCSAGTAFIQRNTTVCLGSSWANLSLTYTGINNRRKQIADFDIDREFSEHTATYPTEMFYNETLGLWRTTYDHEYYDIGLKDVFGNCSYTSDSTLDNNVAEQISIVNSAPIVTASQIFLPSGATYDIVDGVTIEYEDGIWNWTGSVNDLDDNLDYFNVSWYKYDGTLLLNYTNITDSIVLSTPNATFFNFTTLYSINVSAVDTEGASTQAVRWFNVSTYIPDANVTNVVLTSDTCTTGNSFNLTGTYECVGDTNCTGIWNITTSSGSCTTTDGNGGTYNIENGTSSSESGSWACIISADYIFNFTLDQNDGDDIQYSNLSITCSAAGGGLTADESSCILTGYYVNGSLCGSLWGEGLDTNVCPTTPGGMLIMFLIIFMSLGFIILGWVFKLSFSGFLGSLMLLIASWTLYGCMGLLGALTAFIALMCLVWFALNWNHHLT